MDNSDTYQHLLDASRLAYQAHAELSAFASFPDDIIRQPITPYHLPASDILTAETQLHTHGYAQVQSAIIKACPIMRWREIYHDADADISFMDRLGCTSIIGGGAPFTSKMLRLFVVYMPGNLHYPWHTHPAEEMYLVISGKAQFKRAGDNDVWLEEGQTMYHPSHLAHAIQTGDTPMLSLVAWRNHLDTPPVLVKNMD